MINVYSDSVLAGFLEKEPQKPGYVFTYRPDADQRQSVSLTMPARLKSYVSPAGYLHPIFDMNLPEGFLRNYLIKAIPDCYDLKLLQITGPSQLGRLVYQNPEDADIRIIPEYSVPDILAFDGAEDLFNDLLGMYAAASGVSGVQPKVLVRDLENIKISPDHKLAVRATTHIVKTWDAQYPQLAYNEHFCLLAVKYSGLPTPYWEVSKNGKFLVVERFDLTEENRYLGFEDFCVLAGLPSSKKYYGSYEQLTKILQNFSLQDGLAKDLAKLFKMIAISVVLRNGDAHRKNFCLIYDCPVSRRGKLAPTFDVVTTTGYLANDVMALTLEGSKRWPTQKRLLRFATKHCGLQNRQAIKILEEIKEGTSKAQKELEYGVKHLKGFAEIGQKISEQWKQGLAI